MNKVFILDSTLRDGAQSVGISFSVQDKIKIARILDDLQVDYIEAGNPGSNPKDLEFFELLREVPLKHSKVAAFGATRKKHTPVEEDAKPLLPAGRKYAMRLAFSASPGISMSPTSSARLCMKTSR